MAVGQRQGYYAFPIEINFLAAPSTDISRISKFIGDGFRSPSTLAINNPPDRDQPINCRLADVE